MGQTCSSIVDKPRRANMNSSTSHQIVSEICQVLQEIRREYNDILESLITSSQIKRNDRAKMINLLTQLDMIITKLRIVQLDISLAKDVAKKSILSSNMEELVENFDEYKSSGKIGGVNKPPEVNSTLGMANGQNAPKKYEQEMVMNFLEDDGVYVYVFKVPTISGDGVQTCASENSGAKDVAISKLKFLIETLQASKLISTEETPPEQPVDDQRQTVDTSQIPENRSDTGNKVADEAVASTEQSGSQKEKTSNVSQIISPVSSQGPTKSFSRPCCKRKQTLTEGSRLTVKSSGSIKKSRNGV